MYILGAGLAGCIAGAINPNATILEASETPPDNHKAVLRFRTGEIGRACGIPFEQVTVHKGIWFEDKFVEPNPMVANLYSRKVAGKILDRSIWKTDTVTRYVAPCDFHMQLLDMLKPKIQYGQRVGLLDIACAKGENRPTISTMPLPVLANILGYDIKSETKRAPIHTLRGKVVGCNTHQTVYFPSLEDDVYRATLTGEDLIIESIVDKNSMHINPVLKAFGLNGVEIDWEGESHIQNYGKIAPMSEAERKAFIYWASQEHGIFSLGRFATWRNILLDDVLKDVYKIREIQNLTGYDLANSQ